MCIEMQRLVKQKPKKVQINLFKRISILFEQEEFNEFVI